MAQPKDKNADDLELEIVPIEEGAAVPPLESVIQIIGGKIPRRSWTSRRKPESAPS